MALTDPMVLPADLILVPVSKLPELARSQVQAEEGDYALTRRRSRTPSLIIDPRAAALLEEFRKPITIVEAVIQYSRENKADPEQTLDEAFPMLERLLNARLLVPVDSEEARRVRQSLQVGTLFAGAEVVECVRVLDDTEIYRVTPEQGKSAALKILRPNAGPELAQMLDREAAILGHLDGSVSPTILRNGTEGPHRFLMVSWCSGRECSAVAAELRRSGSLDTRQRLIRLCGSILDAYARLHAEGVIHSDVHPLNILVAEEGSAKIIDFGLAHLAGIESEPGGMPRGGVGFFFEPEYAKAVRAGAWPPESTELGEQYALAALIYFLVTGSHYLNFCLGKEEMLRQIEADPPLEFTQLGLAPWPEVEEALTRALSKRPCDRFSSVAEFAARLKSIEMSETASATLVAVGATPVMLSDAEQMLAGLLARLDQRGLLFASGLRTAPKVSVTYGSAGVAYGLYRIACAREDARLLSLADLWATRAARDIFSGDAFYNPDIGITPEIVGMVSPYHTASGVHVVRGLISCAMGDVFSIQIAIEKFLAAVAAAPCEKLDLTVGRSGTLLAAALLLDAIGGNPFVTASSLMEFGNQMLDMLIERIKQTSPISECLDIPYVGVSHGWAGILYAAMSWCRSSGRELPDEIGNRLEQLGQLADQSGDSVRWRVRGHDSEVKAYLSGWCNGSAGFVHLWTLAHRMLRNAKYLTLAEKAGFATASIGGQIGNLCCGFAGQAYALLNLYKYTNDKKWLGMAHSLVPKAVRSVQDIPAGGAGPQLASRAESLYEGQLGIAVLTAELGGPEFAAMPFFESDA